MDTCASPVPNPLDRERSGEKERPRLRGILFSKAMPGVVVVVVGIFVVGCSNNEHANDRPKIDISPWLRSEFSRDWGFRGQLCPFAPSTTSPSSSSSSLPPPSLGPARDKRGPAPVDNGPMALRMQAQGSALFEFVAFCLCLSAATPPPLPPPSFSSHTCPRPARSAPRRSVPPVIRSSPDPLPTHPRGSILQIAIANLPALCLLALFPFGPSASPLNLLESVNRGGLGGSGDAWFFADVLLIDGIFSIGTEQRRRNKKTGGDARRRRRG